MKADLICVPGDPSGTVGLFGQPGAIRHVFVDGVAMDLTPPRERNPLSGC